MEGDRRLAHTVPTRLSSTYTEASGRKFGLTVGAAFVVLALIARWRGHAVSFLTLGVIGMLLLLAGLVIPTALGPVERAWMGLAKAISRITTPLFMSVLYFLVLTPIAVIRRAIGGNPLVHRAGPLGFWSDRRELTRGSMDHQF